MSEMGFMGWGNFGVHVHKLLIWMVVLVALAGLALPGGFVKGAGVVGTGTPESCTEAAFDAALAGGGVVSFNCGSGMHTIIKTGEKVIATNTSTARR